MIKISFVHCRIFPGGALKVLKDLINEEIEKTPESEIQIFTLVSEKNTLKIGDSEFKIITALPSRLNRLFTGIFDYRNLIIVSPFLMKILSHKIKKFHPDRIIISSFAIAKNIDQCRGSFVSLYLHSPMQYIRSHYDEYSEKLQGRKGKIFQWIVPRLRRRDKKFTQFDEVIANSKYTAQCAKDIYGIDAKIKYPITSVPSTLGEQGTTSYYVFIGRLVRFVKETDKIIQLFNTTQDPLIIIGSGPDEAYLKSIAKGNIIFIDRMENETERCKILERAKGFINLTKESFGLATAEALLLGVPVFGYRHGATGELVDKDSGVLVEKKDPETLLQKFQEFKSKQRNREKIMRSIKSKINS